MARRTATHHIILLCTSLIFGSCAEVAPPPGGEVDKTAPRIVSSVPANGATSVTPGSTISIRFSETMNQPVGKSVFVSPRPPKDPKVKWRGDELQIRLDSLFAPNQTYVISVMRTVTDLRGNTIDSLTQLAFSTGSFIDSGIVKGSIQLGGKPAASMAVGLFSMAEMSRSNFQWDSAFPQYLTTTNKSGEFDFRYVPTREFALVAFADANRNERVGYGSEAIGIPDRKIIPSVSDPTTLWLTMSATDTSKAQILSASWTSDELLRIRLSKPILVRHPNTGTTSIDLVLETDSTVRFYARGVLESDSMTSTVSAAFDRLPVGKFAVQAQFDTVSPKLVYSPVIVDSVVDKTAPKLIGFSLNKAVIFTHDSAAIFEFSEPIDRTPTIDSAFVLYEQGKSPMVIGGKWDDPFRYRMAVPEFAEGMQYTAAVDLSRLRDRAGNACGDTVQQFQFHRVSSDSLGTLSGRVEIDTLIHGSKTELVLTFQRMGMKQDFVLRDARDNFSITLPSGKYLVSVLVDRDGNGFFTPGTLTPYTLSETTVRHPDTLAVRPRFETAGINISVR